MKKRHFISSILVSFMVAINPVLAESISTITEDVTTEFGTYQPETVTVTPSVTPYNIENDLSNIINIGDFELGYEAKNLLSTNGFAAEASPYRQIYDVYNECKDRGIPIFVTTDACLHTYHILYDYILRVLEINYFIDDLDTITQAMIKDMQATYDAASDSSVKEAAAFNIAYLSVPYGLLHPEASNYPGIAAEEIELILEGSEGYVNSPLLYSEDYPYQEDYSQYKPRGHYTRTPELERYFRAMMWYGRITFSLNLPYATEQGIRHAAVQALLLCRSLENASLGPEISYPASELWERIYEPTVFFVGKTDDIDHNAYIELALNHFGGNFTQLSPDILADEDKLDAFIDDALQLPDPKITVKAGKGYRFMGQRFIPDSYVLDQLVEEFVRSRFMPRGLDVMAVLGSDRAYEIIDTVYHDPDLYPDYDEQLTKLKQEFMGYAPEIWAQNLYFNWLYTLTPLLAVKGQGYPLFMQNIAWIEKNLNTALGSWSELRHDTILYAKQSETLETAYPDPQFIKGYVEPEPEVYARLAALARYTRQGLQNKGLLDELFEDRLIDFTNLMLALKTIAVKELQNITPSNEEYAFICNFGTTIEALTSFPPEFENQYENEADKFMAVIADVHTDPNLNECLEVGVGHPLNIYVIAPVNGIPTLTKGCIFSYHEFKRSLIEGRLTDEEWQEMQSSERAKNMPEWTSSFLAGESSLKKETYNFPSNKIVVTLVEKEDTVPTSFALFQNQPNPFNPSTTISYHLPKSGQVKLVIYNLSGQVVDTLVNEWQEAGLYSFRWLPNNFATGIYLARISTNSHTGVIKMLFMK